MFKLLRYFSITSLLAFILVAALLGVVYRRAALNDLIEIEKSKNVALTQAFINSLWPQFAPFIASASTLDSDELRTHPETARFRQAVRDQMKDRAVCRVKIYNPKGVTVFSTEIGQRGEDRSGKTGYRSARSAKVAR